MWTRASSYDEKSGIRTLTQVDLEEVSIVTSPANDRSRIDAVKMKLAHGTLPSIKEFEQIQREAGFSRTQAAIIASHGFKHLLSDSEKGRLQPPPALLTRCADYLFRKSEVYKNGYA
ncbi:MAG: HK97 family phage prohead protease [Rhizobiaceae bacterium]